MSFDRGEIRMKATNISIMDRKGGKSIMGCRVMSGAKVSAVLESATWSSSSVFSSFYLRHLQHDYDGLLSLGPFVAAGTRIG